GALYGLLAVLFGAFGAHAVKKVLPPEVLRSFETRGRYEMYHALSLLVLGCHLRLDRPVDTAVASCFIFGTLLCSFSIYALCLGAAKGKKRRYLGPVTPLGGLLLALGWGMLLYSFVESLF